MLPPAFSMIYNAVNNPGFFSADPLNDVMTWVVPLILLAALIPVRRWSWQVAGLLLLVIDRLVVIFA